MYYNSPKSSIRRNQVRYNDLYTKSLNLDAFKVQPLVRRSYSNERASSLENSPSKNVKILSYLLIFKFLYFSDFLYKNKNKWNENIAKTERSCTG